jgi:hypothetical protein
VDKTLQAGRGGGKLDGVRRREVGGVVQQWWWRGGDSSAGGPWRRATEMGHVTRMRDVRWLVRWPAIGRHDEHGGTLPRVCALALCCWQESPACGFCGIIACRCCLRSVLLCVPFTGVVHGVAKDLRCKLVCMARSLQVMLVAVEEGV